MKGRIRIRNTTSLKEGGRKTARDLTLLLLEVVSVWNLHLIIIVSFTPFAVVAGELLLKLGSFVACFSIDYLVDMSPHHRQPVSTGFISFWKEPSSCLRPHKPG